MGTNLDQFVRQIDKVYEEKVVRKFLEIHKSISINAYQMISADSRIAGMQYGSPVWTGRYRASHRISIGSLDGTYEPETLDSSLRWPEEPDSTIRNQPISYAAGVLSTLKPFSVVYISNSLPYARKIEFGHSKLKAPNGVYKITIEVLKQKYKNADLQGIVFS